MNPEKERLQQVIDAQAPWHKWGSYLSERQWGTIREDYSVHPGVNHYGLAEEISRQTH